MQHAPMLTFHDDDVIHRTLTKLTFGTTNQPATMEISMVSVDLSRKQLGPSGASVLAAFLPKCTYVPCAHVPISPLDTPI